MTPAFYRVALAAFLVLAGGASAADAASDRHAGYYYPPPQTEEAYESRSRMLLDADRKMRMAFINTVTAEQQSQPYPPQYAMYAKGAEAEKMIIVSLRDGAFDTLYRARALLAQLSSVARRTPFFREHKVEDLFTFFDLLNLLGFKQLTISDGESFAHRVWIK